MPTSDQLIQALAKAIGIEEGYFAKSSRGPTIPQRLHNPGDLRSWKKPDGTSYPQTNGYADFPACERQGCSNPDHPSEVGWRALRAQVKINVFKRRLTFFEFFNGKRGVYGGFAPAGDKNDPGRYAQHVCDYVNKQLGTNATTRTVIATLVEGNE